MYISALEEFLDITRLKSQPDYVSELFKTVHSKNITIEEWNTFIVQFQEFISQSADTYLGFKHVLKSIVELSDLQFSVGTGFSKGTVRSEDSIAGVKGLYYDISGTNILWLYEDQACTKSVTRDFVENVLGWEYGDTLSLVNDRKYDAVTKIDGFVQSDRAGIFVAPYLPFSNKVVMSEDDINFDDFSVINLDKPDKGLVDLGFNAIAFGTGNKSINYNATSFGIANTVYGQHGFTNGMLNEITYLSAGFGREQLIKAHQSFGTGLNNTIENGAIQSFVANRENTVKSGICTSVFGYKNVVDVGNAKSSNFVTGSENKVNYGMVNFIGGFKNELLVGDKGSDIITNSIISGTENKVYGGQNTLIVGKQNTVKNNIGGYSWSGSQSIVGGLQNTLGNNSANCLLVGRGNISDTQNQSVLGKYNRESSNALLIVGNGVSTTERSNAFEVLHNDGLSALKVGETVVTEEELKKLQNKYTVQGLYLFNETLDTGNVQLECDVNFSCRGVAYSKLTIDMSQGMISYNNDSVWYEGFWHVQGWRTNGSHRLLYFGAEPQEVPKEVYDYLMANGKFSPAGNATFTLLENGSNLYNVGVFPYENGMTWEQYVNSAYNLDQSNMFMTYSGIVCWYIGDGGYQLYACDTVDDDGRPVEYYPVEPENGIIYPYYFFSN